MGTDHGMTTDDKPSTQSPEQPSTTPSGAVGQEGALPATGQPKPRGQKPIKEKVGGPLTHIVMFSGGMGSYLAAKRTVAKYGTDRVKLLFADTTIEDEDLYRFLHQAADLLGCELVVLKDGRDVWQVYKDARYIGNTRADPCSQVLKRQPLNRWVAERYHPEDCRIVVGIDWSEIHRYHRLQERNHPWIYSAPLCEAPYLDPPGMRRALDEDGLDLPRLYAMGMPHNNCFSGDTRFITDEGIRSLEETSGKSVNVLAKTGSRGISVWAPAFVRSFGIQQIWRLTLRRYTNTKVIHTTADHRWFRRKGRKESEETITRSLRKGDMILSTYGRLGGAVRPSAFAIAQGIVFGDGTYPRTTNGPGTVTLCGEKNRELLRFFPLSPAKEVPGIGMRVADLPRTWKDLPSLNESQSFLYGWLAGYFAADGCVTRGCVKISSSNRRHLEFAAEVCVRIGICVESISTESRIGLGRTASDLHSMRFSSSTLRDDFFILKAHRERFEAINSKTRADWSVESCEETDLKEEVYCATVPGAGNFTLEGNISTGNCGGFCCKAGQAQFAHLLKIMPERYRHHEEKEQELRSHLQKDVAILRDRTGGTTRPLTLKALRERIEAKQAYDKTEWGGCGCFAGT